MRATTLCVCCVSLLQCPEGGWLARNILWGLLTLSYIVGDSEVHDAGGDHECESADIADVTAVPAEVSGGGLAHADPLLNSGIRLQVSGHGGLYIWGERRVEWDE